MSDDLVRGFRSLVSAKVASSVIGIASLPLVVRVLGPSGYGDYAFLMSTFSLLMLLVSPWVTEGVQKFVAERRSVAHWRESVVGFYLRFALALASAGTVVLASLTYFGVVEWFLEPRFTVFFYFLSALVLAIQLQVLVRHTLLGLGLEQFSESFFVLRKLIARVGGLALAALGLGVVGFLAADVVSAVVVVVGGFVVLRGRISMDRVLGERPSVPRRELLSFNGLNVVTVVLMMSLLHVDVMMVRLIEGGSQAGYYKAALVLAEYVLLVPKALQSLMLHSASRLWSLNELDRIESMASKLTRYVFLATSLLAVGIAVLADNFVPLYFGPEFSATIGPLLVLLPGVVGFALARPVYAINKGSGNLRILVYALAVSAVFNAVANYALIPRYGLMGAAVATSTSYGTMFGLQAACAWNLGYSPLGDLRPSRLAATVVVSLVGIYALDAVLASDVVALAVVPGAGFLAFTIAAVSFGAVDDAELREATTVLPSPVARRIRALVFQGE